MKDKYLLDTHIWIWWHSSPEKLSTGVKKIIAQTENTRLYLSQISVWEFCKLVELNKLSLAMGTQAWLESALDMPNLKLVPLSPQIALESTRIPQAFHKDPADQIIVATAREKGAILISADQALLRYPQVQSLKGSR